MGRQTWTPAQRKAVRTWGRALAHATALKRAQRHADAEALYAQLDQAIGRVMSTSMSIGHPESPLDGTPFMRVHARACKTPGDVQ